MLRQVSALLTILIFVISIFAGAVVPTQGAWAENDPNIWYDYRLELIATEIRERFESTGPFVDEQLLTADSPMRMVLILEKDVDLAAFDGVVDYIKLTPEIEGMYFATALLRPGMGEALKNIDGLIAAMMDIPVNFPGQGEEIAYQMYLDLISGKKSIEDFKAQMLEAKRNPQIFLQKFNEMLNSGLKSMAKDPLKIADVELDGPTAEPDMYFVGDLLGQNEIIGGKALKQLYNGSGVTIAVVDTGVEFASLGLYKWNFKVARDITGVVANFDPEMQGFALTVIPVTAYTNASGTYITTQNVDPPVFINWFGFPVVMPFSSWYGSPIPTDMEVTGIMNAGDTGYFGAIWVWRLFLGFFLTFQLHPVLVLDTNNDGIYDSAVVDVAFDYNWWVGDPHDWSFSDDIIISPDGYPTAWWDSNADGLPDYAAGTLSWGLDIFGVAPAASGDTGSILKPIDEEGQYIVLLYDWQSHGTQVANTAAGLDDFTGTQVFEILNFGLYPYGPGIAPNASIMGIPIFWVGSILEAWLWAAGFDLVPGSEGWYFVSNYGTIYGQWQYTGNHKADIISNSWGWVNWEHGTLGWFIYGPYITALLADVLSVPGYIDPAYPGSLFVISAGNEGSAAGTAGPPGHSMFAITAAASTLYTGIYQYLGLAGGFNDTIVFFSSRGQTVAGSVAPELAGVGAWGFTPTVNFIVFSWNYIFSAPPINGTGLDVFGGTSMAAPVISGSAAVVYQAYFDTYGVWPTPDTVKRILMKSAYEMDVPVAAAGAGRVDVYKAVMSILNGDPDVFAIQSGTNLALRSLMYLVVRDLFLGETPLVGNSFLFPAAASAWGDYQLFDWFEIGTTVTGYPALIINDFAGTGPHTYQVSVVYEKLVYEEHISDAVTGYDGPWLFNRARSFVYTPWMGSYDFIRVQLTMDYETVFDDGDFWFDETNLYLYVWDWVDTNFNGQPEFNELALIDQAPFWGSSMMVLIPEDVIANLQGVLLISVRETWNWHSHPIDPQFTVSFEYWKFEPHPWIMPSTPSVTVPANGFAVVSLDLTIPANTEPSVEQGFVLIDDPATPEVDMRVPFSFLLYMTTDTSVGLVDPVPIEPYGEGYLSPNYVRGLFEFSAPDTGDHRAWFFQYQGDPERRTFGIYAHALWESPFTDIDLFSVDAGLMVNDKSVDTWDGYRSYQLTRGGPREEFVAVWPWPLATLITGGAPDMVWMWNRLYDGGDNYEMVFNSIRYAKLDWPNSSVFNNTAFNSYKVPGGVIVEVPFRILTGVNLSSVIFFNYNSDPNISISFSPSIASARAFWNNNTVILSIFIEDSLMQQIFNTGPQSRNFEFMVTADYLPYVTLFRMKIVIEPFPLPIKTMIFTGDKVFWIDLGRFTGWIYSIWYYDFDPTTETFGSEVNYVHRWPVRVTRVWASQEFGIVDIVIGISYNDGTMGWVPATIVVWRYADDVWIAGGINFLP